MGIFGFGTRSLFKNTGYNEIVDRYERFRPVRFRLNNELVRRLPIDALKEGAKKLGILRRGVFVFENEDESSVLMDYCVYNVHRNGCNAVERYLSDCPPKPDSDEQACLHAMQNATYALVAVLSVEPGVGCHVRNLFTEETRLLADIGLSKSAQPGMLIATRLLDFGDLVATGGAALPVGVLNSDELEKWQRKIRTGVHDAREDPAELIRGLLERGVSSHVRYEGLPADHRLDAKHDSLPAGNSIQRAPTPAKRHSGKPAENRRCRCGSGKMFKNCCGKKAKSIPESS